MNEVELLTALTRHVAGVFRLFEDFPEHTPFYVHVPGWDVVTVEIVDKNLKYSFEAAESDVYMVFKVDDLNFYRIDGYKDSYGGSEWSNRLTKVTTRVKVVYVYE